MNIYKTKAKKRVLIVSIVAFTLVAIILVGARIHFVNANAVSLPDVERYATGERVDLEGAFLSTISENTKGYSICVKGAELISYNEYIEKYGLENAEKKDGLDQKSLIDIEIEIENVENDDGFLFIFECKLIPERKNTYMIPSTDLLALSEKNMDGNNARALRISKNSKYTIHVPYKVNVKDPENYTEYRNPIKDTSFELVVSNSPVRKVIEIEL